MVEDSIMQKFNGGDVAVAGIDIWNSSDAEIDSFITATGATFPIAKNGASVGSSYGVIANSMVVIDQNGVVRFVQQLGTSTVTFSQMRQMVGGAAATVRGLLSSGAVDRRISAHPALLDAAAPLRRYTLSGRMVSGPMPSAHAEVASGSNTVRLTVPSLGR